MSRSLETPCWIFWDASNTLRSLRAAAVDNGESNRDRYLRLHFQHFYELARAGREVRDAYVAGSDGADSFWERLGALGFTADRLPSQDQESGVDQALQVRMLRTLADTPAPGVAVLITGDGAGYEEGVGFYSDLERMWRGGWGVEVLSWNSSCNRYLRDWAIRHGEFIPLDRYYRAITFVEGGRTMEKLSTRTRPRALPGRKHTL